MNYNQSLKYQKYTALQREFKYRFENNNNYNIDDIQKSVSWYYIYQNILTDINRSSNPEHIDILKFVARYAIRQIQLLGCDLHKDIIQGHYLREKIQQDTLRIVTNPEIIKQTLEFRLSNPDCTVYWKEYERIITEELVKLGYEDAMNNPVVLLWGQLGSYGKWKLDNLVKDAYNKLDFFVSRPAKNAKETILNFDDSFIGIYDRDHTTPSYQCVKVKGKKKIEKVVEFVFPI